MVVSYTLGVARSSLAHPVSLAGLRSFNCGALMLRPHPFFLISRALFYDGGLFVDDFLGTMELPMFVSLDLSIIKSSEVS